MKRLHQKHSKSSGEFAWIGDRLRAVLQSYREDAEAALPLCQQALSLILADHVEARIHMAIAQLYAYYISVANNASAAVESSLQAVTIAQATGAADSRHRYDGCHSYGAARNGKVG